MIFLVGTTFILGSWIYEADDNSKLQSHLMKISTPQVSLDVSTTTLDQLAEKFSYLSISDSTRTREVITNQDSHSGMSGLEIPSEVQDEDLVRFPLGLENSASIYQDTISYIMQSEQEIPLAGA
jgi:cystathionine beta-lyase/cystathionine gamma-synthase